MGTLPQVGSVSIFLDEAALGHLYNQLQEVSYVTHVMRTKQNTHVYLFCT